MYGQHHFVTTAVSLLAALAQASVVPVQSLAYEASSRVRYHCDCGPALDRNSTDAAVGFLITQSRSKWLFDHCKIHSDRSFDDPLKPGSEVYSIRNNVAAFACNGAVSNDTHLAVSADFIAHAMDGVARACGRYTSGAYVLNRDNHKGSTDTVVIGHIPNRPDRKYCAAALNFGRDHC